MNITSQNKEKWREKLGNEYFLSKLYSSVREGALSFNEAVNAFHVLHHALQRARRFTYRVIAVCIRAVVIGECIQCVRVHIMRQQHSAMWHQS